MYSLNKYNTSFITTILWISTLLIFTPSCEDNNAEKNQDDNEDSIVVVDTVRFQDLTTLFQNRCYHCHSEPEYSFYALNLDSYQNTMLGSQNGSIVVPYDPENSLLYTKCSSEYIQGDRMPQDNISFFDNHPEKLQLIYDWILFGCLE